MAGNWPYGGFFCRLPRSAHARGVKNQREFLLPSGDYHELDLSLESCENPAEKIHKNYLNKTTCPQLCGAEASESLLDITSLPRTSYARRSNGHASLRFWGNDNGRVANTAVVLKFLYFGMSSIVSTSYWLRLQASQ